MYYTRITSPRLPRSPDGIFDMIKHIKGVVEKKDAQLCSWVNSMFCMRESSCCGGKTESLHSTSIFRVKERLGVEIYEVPLDPTGHLPQ